MKNIFLLLFAFSTVFGALNKKFELAQIKQIYPNDITKLRNIVAEANKNDKKISLVGANKSQGGQTSLSKSIRINLSKFNKILSLNIAEKTVTVQAGIKWSDLIKALAPYRLSVKCMQSYSDFSVGGSLSVNVHGRDVVNNPLINSIYSFKLLMSDGKILNVSRSENYNLFKAVIGGYGLFGIIVEVTLNLTDDVLLESEVSTLCSHDLVDFFHKNIKDDPSVQFYSARFSLGNELLEKVIVDVYRKTDKGNSSKYNLNTSRLLNNAARKVFSLMSGFTFLKNIRFYFESIYFKSGRIISRNNFMNNSLESLPKENSSNMYILQEYFVPYKNVNKFIIELKNITKKLKVNLLNITARHVNADQESLMSYSPKESCAFVLYIHVKKAEAEYEKIAFYTDYLINTVINLDGKYYLPYQLIASKVQFGKAYPNFNCLSNLKKSYDPKEIFTNNFYYEYS